MKTRAVVVAALLTFMLSVPAGIAAAQSASDGYSGVAGLSTGGNAPGPSGGESGAAPAATTTVSGQQLPFTGLELALVAGGGLLLLVAGASLRRLSTSRDA